MQAGAIAGGFDEARVRAILEPLFKSDVKGSSEAFAACADYLNLLVAEALGPQDPAQSASGTCSSLRSWDAPSHARAVNFAVSGPTLVVVRADRCGVSGDPTGLRGRVLVERLDAFTGDVLSVLLNVEADFHRPDLVAAGDGRVLVCQVEPFIRASNRCAILDNDTMTTLLASGELLDVTNAASLPTGGGFVTYNGSPYGPFNAPAPMTKYDAAGALVASWTLSDAEFATKGHPKVAALCGNGVDSIVVLARGAWDNSPFDLWSVTASTGAVQRQVALASDVDPLGLACLADGTFFLLYQDSAAMQVVHRDANLDVLNTWTPSPALPKPRIVASPSAVFLSDGLVIQRFSLAGVLEDSFAPPRPFTSMALNGPSRLLLGVSPSAADRSRLMELDVYTYTITRAPLFERPLTGRCPVSVAEDPDGFVWLVFADDNAPYVRRLLFRIDPVDKSVISFPVSLAADPLLSPLPSSITVVDNRLVVTYGRIVILDRSNPSTVIDMVGSNYAHCWNACRRGDWSHFYCVNAVGRNSFRFVRRIETAGWMESKTYRSQLSDYESPLNWRASCDARGNIAQIFFAGFNTKTGVQFWNVESTDDAGTLGSRSGTPAPALTTPLAINALPDSGQVLLIDDRAASSVLLSCAQPALVRAARYPREASCQVTLTLPSLVTSFKLVRLGPAGTLFGFNGTHMNVVDPAAGLVRAFELPAGRTAVCVDAVSGHTWAAGGGTLLRLDPFGTVLDTVPYDQSPWTGGQAVVGALECNWTTGEFFLISGASYPSLVSRLNSTGGLINSMSAGSYASICGPQCPEPNELNPWRGDFPFGRCDFQSTGYCMVFNSPPSMYLLHNGGVVVSVSDRGFVMTPRTPWLRALAANDSAVWDVKSELWASPVAVAMSAGIAVVADALSASETNLMWIDGPAGTTLAVLRAPNTVVTGMAGDETGVWVVSREDVRRCVLGQEAITTVATTLSTVEPTQEPRVTPVLTSTGGLIAGIVLIALVPVVLLALVYVLYRSERFIHAQRVLRLNPYLAGQMTSATAAADAARTMQRAKRALIAKWVFWSAVAVVTLAGAGLTLYTVYDVALFMDSVSDTSALVPAEASRALVRVRAWADVDCSIETTVPACECTASGAVWQCALRAVAANGTDCTVAASPQCLCAPSNSSSWFGDDFYPTWSCASAPNSQAQSFDFGLRFIPPGALGAGITATATFSRFTARNDTPFGLAMGGLAVHSIAPITTVLLLSLIVELIGLAVLLVSASCKFAIYVDRLPPTRKLCGRTVVVDRVFSVADLGIFATGLILFGTVLIVAFTSPIVTGDQVAILTLSHDPLDRSARNVDSYPGVSVRPLCSCVSLPSPCSCVGATAVLAASEVIVSNRSIAHADLLVQGSLLVSARLVVGGSLTVLGPVRLDQAPVLVAGTLTVRGGSLSGSLFGSVWARHSYVGGDLVVEQGDFVLAGDADLSFVRGRVTVVGGSFACAKLWLATITTGAQLRALTTSGRGLVHATTALNVSMIAASIGPAVMTLPLPLLPLASCDLAVPRVSSATFVYDWVERNKPIACSASSVSLVVASARTVSLRYLDSCVVASMTNDSSVPAFALSGTSRALTSSAVVGPFASGGSGPLGYTQRNCGSPTQYFLERAWLSTWFSSGVDESFWTMCPKASIVWDDAALCVWYTCNGPATFPTQSATSTLVSVQENIIQGVTFDAVITGLDLIGIVIEFFVMPLVLMRIKTG